jgi:hypothetical protein
VAAVALLAVLVPAAAHAAEPAVNPAVNPADEVFYPEGQEPPAKPDKPADKPVVKPVDKPADKPADEPTTDAVADVPEDLSGPSDRDREAAHARGSRMAVDLMGWRRSLYQGKWFMPGKEDVRRCILDRESNFNYRATSGVYHGAYQMSAALARGATWMMQPEVRREMGEEGVAIVEALRELTPNRWNRYWQDRAFWTIWRDGEGASHWRGGC